jgi:hypothetical protein
MLNLDVAITATLIKLALGVRSSSSSGARLWIVADMFAEKGFVLQDIEYRPKPSTPL